MATFGNSNSNTLISGGTENDSIYNSGDSVTITSGGGDDTIENIGTKVSIDAGEGDDSVFNAWGSSNVSIDAGDGADTIYNGGDNVTISGGEGNDSIYSYGASSRINSGDGADTISNEGDSVTIDGGDGDDSISNSDDNVSINGNDGDDTIDNTGNNVIIQSGDGNDFVNNWYGCMNTKIDGGAGDDSIWSNSSKTSVAGGAGNDSIINRGGLSSTIDGGDGSDTISNSGNNISLLGGLGDDSIKNSGSQVTIDGGTDDDYIYNSGANVLINSGDGNDYIWNWNDSITIKAGAGDDTIENESSNATINGGEGDDSISNNGASSTLDGGAGNDTLSGSIFFADVFVYENGNDVITNYSGEDTVQISSGKIDSYSFDGGDLIFHIGDGSLRLKNMTNHAVTVKDSSGETTKIYSNGYSPQQVIKNFVQSSSRSIINSKLMLDEAIKACSNFNSMQEVIDKMVADCEKANSAATFLQDYCGIIHESYYDNGYCDNGSAVGWATGGLTMKSFKDLYTADGDAVYPESTTFTIRGLTITVPEKDTLTEEEQLVVKGFYSWWAEDAIKLVEESYGVHLDGQKMKLEFMNDTKTSAIARGGAYKIIVNMAKVNPTEENLRYHLSSTIAHEMTHVMQGNFGIMEYSTSYMDEGMARLTEGIYANDWADNPEKLAYYLDLNNKFIPDTMDYGYMYSVGYMFWRYLMKQASDSYDSLASYSWKEKSSIVGTSADELLTGNGKSVTISAGAGNDTITAYGKKMKIFGEDGDDYILVSSLAGGTSINGGEGNDSIENYYSEKTSINGGANADYIYNKGNSVTINGGAGNDSIKNYGEKTSINGGADADYIYNEKNSVTIVAGEGDDTVDNEGGQFLKITASKGDNFIYNSTRLEYSYNSETQERETETICPDKTTIVTGAGNDYIRNFGASVSINSGLGNDTIDNRGASSTILALGGNDSIRNYSGSEVTINSGAGDDYIFNWYGDNVSVNVGAGNDSIDNHGGENATINANKGDDTINNHYGKNVLFQYAAGDGNDSISGFNETSTLSISDFEYSTTKSGTDIIVTVDEDKITLTGATYLSALNIDGVERDPKLLRLTNNSSAKITLDSTVETIDASKRTKAVEIVGNNLDNTIIGGKGNDTLTGGEGNDVFVYTAGNDFIADYAAGDKISLNASITSSSVKGSDATFKIGKNTLSVKNGKGKEIVFADKDGNERTILGGAFLTDDSTKSKVTLSAAWREIADASARTKSIKIVGNAQDNSIFGGSAKDYLYGKDGDDLILGNAGSDKIYGQTGNDTLIGGAGNDTFTGGAGNDLFVVDAGNDVISDYAAGDKISVTAEIISSSVKGSDATFKIGKNTLTVKDGKSKEITFINKDGKERTIFGGAFLADDSTNSKVTLSAAWREIADASERTKSIKIVGNAQDNSIFGGSAKDYLYGKDGDDLILGNAGADKLYGQNGNDTLIGGKGNDSLWGGDGADTFIYNSGDGKDVIFGFDNSDMLQITGEFSATYNKTKKTIAFKVDDTASAITLKNFTATTFNINGDIYRISGTKLIRN